MIHETRSNRPSFWDYALCYSLYFLVLGAAFEAFWVWRSTIEVVVGFLYRKSDARESAYMLGTLFAGLMLFVAVLAGEDYLRRALARRYGEIDGYHGVRRLFMRFARLLVSLVATLAIAVAAQEGILRQAGL